MKKLRFLIVFTLLSVQVFSQTNILFHEKFDDNQNNWYVGTTDFYDAKIEGGQYIIATKDKLRNFYHEEYINPQKDFYIECQINLLDQGEKNYGFGMVFGSSYTEQYYFDISKGGYFLIYGYKGGETEYYAEWTESNAVKAGQNVMIVHKKGESMSFYINGVKVHEQKALRLLGKYVGFTIGANTKIAVDYLLIKHPPTSMNIVPDVMKGYVRENLGSNINSVTDELHPLPSHDGKTLYFTRDEHPKNIGEKKLQDIWYSTLQSNGSWGPATQMPAPLNTAWHNSTVSVSPDNNTLFMDFDEGEETGDKQGLYVSHRLSSGWSEPEEVKIMDYYNYNQYESYHISANRKVMITSLERDDTHGSKDIYVCFLQDDGSWSAPKNLGSTVNTYGDELTPFLAADNKTLYYASYGLKGYGSSDIYVTRRLDNSWTNWSTPQNLGDEINTPYWDAYFTISAEGDYAYLVSYDNEKGFGEADAYRIKLADPAKPEPVLWITGTVYDKFTNKPMQSEINYEVIGMPEESGVAISDPENGYYQIVLPYGEEYDLRAVAPGHVPISEHIDADQGLGHKEILKDLYLEPIAVGKVFNLQNVLFERGKATLLQSSYQELDKLVKLMIDNPSLEIELGGHTDNRGDRNELFKLSSDRVEAVNVYLISKGISSHRITGKGYGRSQPITKNRTEEERKLNRRVEFKVLKY